MRTVKELQEELEKFPDDALCFAYEGEVTGIIIFRLGREIGPQGVIHCCDRDEPEAETELLK